MPNYRRRSRGSRWKPVLILVVILALLGGGGALVVSRMGGLAALKAKLAGTPNAGPDQPAMAGSTPTHKRTLDLDLPSASQPFPRRALAIGVTNYWYANPVHYSGLGTVLKRMAGPLHIPESQVYELSDGAPESRTPTKEVIKKTIDEFLAGSRAQDRVLVLFAGHAVEIDGAGYLVPIEGDLKTAETLLPLQEVYDALAKCKARQKLLILDVCRFDPSRGLERPGSGPMSAKLDALLQNPPPGVQVWSACVADQYSYEGTIYSADGGLLQLGFFLNQLEEAFGIDKRKRVNLGVQKPDDSLPLEALAQGKDGALGVNKSTASEADYWVSAKQTPRLSGQEAPGGAPYDPKEPLPVRMSLPAPASPADGMAAGALIEQILKETGASAAREGTTPLDVKTLPSFSAKVMEPYKADDAKTPLREAIAKATAILQNNSQQLQFEFRGKGEDAKIKEQIFAQQKAPARVLAELQDALEELQKAGEKRAEEMSPRWQANYDFVLARLEARVAYVNEYDFMLGQIRKDALPKRDPEKYGGWRLASQEKLQSGADAKRLAADSKKMLQQLAKEHKGTPWEILARREALNALGLDWQLAP